MFDSSSPSRATALLFPVFATVAIAACSASPQAAVTPAAEPCAFATAPVVVKRDGAAVLQYWQVAAKPVFFTEQLPRDRGYGQFRSAIRSANAAVMKPKSLRPAVLSRRERDVWSREDHNRELTYSQHGRIRPIQCLEALLFAYQNRRYPQLTQPTEFIASVLRKQIDGRPMLRVYFGASDALFPPKSVYGFDVVAADLKQGWRFVVILHNHTVQRGGNTLVLGVPSPSTSDVRIARSLGRDLGVRTVAVTNGFYTFAAAVSELDAYRTRD